jgi:hypothetical protein
MDVIRSPETLTPTSITIQKIAIRIFTAVKTSKFYSLSYPLSECKAIQTVVKHHNEEEIITAEEHEQLEY